MCRGLGPGILWVEPDGTVTGVAGQDPAEALALAQQLTATMTLAAPAVEAEGLGKRYRATVAVDDFSLRVAPGEVVGLLGPNGAGKSTAVKMLVGLVAATTGTARLFGQPATDPAARRRVGYLPELFRFHDWMTGRQMLLFHARLAGMADSEQLLLIPPVLERVGMARRADERIAGYSKGMTPAHRHRSGAGRRSGAGGAR